MQQSPQLKSFKNTLNNYLFYKEEIKKIEDEIEELYHELSGLHSPNMSSPIVHTPPNKEREYFLRNQIDVLAKKKDYKKAIINDVDEILNRIENNEKTAIIAVYIERKKAVDIANQLHISPTALFNRMNREIKKALAIVS